MASSNSTKLLPPNVDRHGLEPCRPELVDADDPMPGWSKEGKRPSLEE